MRREDKYGPPKVATALDPHWHVIRITREQQDKLNVFVVDFEISPKKRIPTRWYSFAADL